MDKDKYQYILNSISNIETNLNQLKEYIQNIERETSNISYTSNRNNDTQDNTLIEDNDSQDNNKLLEKFLTKDNNVEYLNSNIENNSINHSHDKNENIEDEDNNKLLSQGRIPHTLPQMNTSSFLMPLFFKKGEKVLTKDNNNIIIQDVNNDNNNNQNQNIKVEIEEIEGIENSSQHSTVLLDKEDEELLKNTKIDFLYHKNTKKNIHKKNQSKKRYHHEEYQRGLEII